MKTINVTKRELNFKDYVKRSALESDFSELITESCAIMEGDKLAILYLDFGELGIDTEKLFWAVNTIKYTENTRTNGLKTTSEIFGYSPRVAIRNDFCNVTGMARNFPNQHSVLCDFGKELSESYKKFAPDVFNFHNFSVKEKVKEKWVIPGTPFTSGIVNKNNPLKYHFDSGNFEDVYSNMIVLKNGVDGGYLACPEYGIGLECKNNSVVIFDGQKLLHGVTPIRKISPDGYRYSIVYYSLQQMWKCLEVDEELI